MSKQFEVVILSERRSGRFDGDRKGGGGDNQGSGTPPGPPGDDELKSRVEALEKALPDIRERMVRVETKLDGMEKNMASKADISDIKVLMTEGFNSQTKWFVATAVILAGVAFAGARLIH